MRRYFNLFWILVFLIGSVIPLFHMNTSEITEQENRTLAKLPEIKKKGKLNEGYGKEFESWLGDRFWGRDQLIDTRFQALYKINGRIENEKAFIGDNGWMFMKSKTVNRPSIKKQREMIEKDAKILKAFADKFKDKNIPIYLVLIPEREVLYQKYWERYYKPKPYLDYGDEITKLLKKDTSITIIYPKEEFATASQQLYRKTDLHLNGFGEKKLIDYVYEMITKKAEKKYYTEINPIKKFSGNISKLLNAYPNIQETFLNVKRSKNCSFFEKEDSNKNSGYSHTYRHSSCKKALSPKKIHIIGPCYSSRFFYAFSSYFQESEQMYNNTASKEGQNITQERIKYLYENASKNDIILLIGIGESTLYY